MVSGQSRYQRANFISAVDALGNAEDARDQIVVVEPVGPAHDRSPVAGRIPHKTKPRGDVVPVAWEWIGRRITRDGVADVVPELCLIAHA